MSVFAVVAYCGGVRTPMHPRPIALASARRSSNGPPHGCSCTALVGFAGAAYCVGVRAPIIARPPTDLATPH
eukprot:4724565-Lingulodinium_polyedra.AAC.1